MPNLDLPILVVDDAKFSSMVVGRTLRKAGYRDVRIANNATAALDFIEQRPVSVLIADWLMPEMDGWETIRAIRSDPGLKELPVMAVTSLAEDVESEKRSRQEGFDRWEAKLNKERLLEKLAEMLNIKREAG
mgnify:CR=1 FL=1